MLFCGSSLRSGASIKRILTCQLQRETPRLLSCAALQQLCSDDEILPFHLHADATPSLVLHRISGFDVVVLIVHMKGFGSRKPVFGAGHSSRRLLHSVHLYGIFS